MFSQDTESQCNLILSHLMSGKTITPIEALNKYGCFRLGARIHDLRASGYNIKTNMINQNGKHFAECALQ